MNRIYMMWKYRRHLDMRLKLLRIIGNLLIPKYRFKWHQLEWWSDSQFNDYLNRFGEIYGFNTDRRWMMWQLLRLIDNIPGDTAECGVYKGAGSFLICKSNEESKNFIRMHYLFDSFEGLSAPTINDNSHWMKGDMACDLSIVQLNLSEFKNVSFHRGWIPERFCDIEDNIFAFVHIDVDLYEPTRDSVRFFYPRVEEGGIILCDDYGFTTCPGVKCAIDDYLNDKPEKMITLPDGGGFIIKGTYTS